MYCRCVIDTRQRRQRGDSPPQISDTIIGYLDILSCFLNMSSHTCDILRTWFLQAANEGNSSSSLIHTVAMIKGEC